MDPIIQPISPEGKLSFINRKVGTFLSYFMGSVLLIGSCINIFHLLNLPLYIWKGDRFPFFLIGRIIIFVIGGYYILPLKTPYLKFNEYTTLWKEIIKKIILSILILYIAGLIYSNTFLLFSCKTMSSGSNCASDLSVFFSPLLLLIAFSLPSKNWVIKILVILYAIWMFLLGFAGVSL